MEHSDVQGHNRRVLEPYTLDELYARIEASHAAYLRGEVLTAQEAREELKKEFPWLS